MAAYYKTNHPEIMALVATIHAGHHELAAAVQAFADQFGGKGRVSYSLDKYRFAGVQFDTAQPTDIWTKPDKNRFQFPRGAAKPRLGADRLAALKELRAKWEAGVPKQSVDIAPLYAAMGTDWGILLFHGIGYFTHNDTLYVSTGVILNDKMQEILGSEYKAARDAKAVAA